MKLPHSFSTFSHGTSLRKSILSKLIICYILLVLLPSCIIGVFSYVRSSNSLWESYSKAEKNAYENMLFTLNSRLKDVKNHSLYFTSDSRLTEYLNDESFTISDEVYYYIKFLQKDFRSASLSSPCIHCVTLYPVSEHQLQLPGIIEALSENNLPESVLEKFQNSAHDFWEFETSGENVTLNYYQPIFNNSYSMRLALLKIEVLLPELFTCFPENSEIYYADTDRQLLFECHDLTPLSTPDDWNDLFKSTSHNSILHTDSEVLGGSFITHICVGQTSVKTLLTSILLSLLCCLITSVVYYFLFYSLIQRLNRLSRHIREIDPEHLAPYQTEDQEHDEIGQLIYAYNLAIERINQLLDQVYRSELQKKDAEVYALQAQIQPHFLYNTLENIRMCAEKHHDDQTAAMIASLGSYMRYNLHSSKTETSLMEELHHVKNYTDIFKLRMGERFQFQISVFAEIMDLKCPYFILQPIVENILKHAMPPSRGLSVEITVKEQDESEYLPRTVIVQIQDNGIGIPEDKLNELQAQLRAGSLDTSGHVGLNNVNYRLIQYYGPDHFIRISSKENSGTTVTLLLRS